MSTVEIDGGRTVGVSFVPAAVPAKKAPPAQPEPTGHGIRVVMQRLAITAAGVLDAPFMFQVPPTDELPVERAWNYTDYDTIGDGIHTRPGSSALATVSFDSLFVDYAAPFVVNRAASLNPIALIDELVTIGESKTPFQLIVGQPNLWGIYYDVNMAVTMRSLRSAEKAGETDARYYSVSFTQFRGIAASDLASGLASGVGSGTPDSIESLSLGGGGQTPRAVLAITDLPKNKDNLRQVSKKYYHTVTLWSVVAKASGIDAPPGVSLSAYYAGVETPPKIVVPPVSQIGSF